MLSEALHAAHHIDACEHGMSVCHAIQHAQPLVVDIKGAREPRHRFGCAFIGLAFDQTDDDGELHRALAPMRIDDARELIERTEAEFVGANLVAVKAREAFNHLRFCFAKVVVAARSVAQRAEY